MPADQATIKKALESVLYPGYSRNIVSFGLVKDIAISGNHISIAVELPSNNPEIAQKIKENIKNALNSFEKDHEIDVNLTIKEAPTAQKTIAELPNIKHKIAIASGKGGVGKSSVTVNLAYALAQSGLTVGILDCDIYGPSIPLMLGASGDILIEDDQLIPFTAHGIKLMSMGLLIDENTPVVWRGPMIIKTIQQFIAQVNWGELDLLLIDLPPGTGDAQLTLSQSIKLNGALIVTTPQLAASSVALRGAQMFAKVNVPLLGVVENMSYYSLPDGSQDFIFGSGGGETVAKSLNIPLLAQIPLSSALRQNADRGQPLLLTDKTSPTAVAYKGLAEKIKTIIAK